MLFQKKKIVMYIFLKTHFFYKYNYILNNLLLIKKILNKMFCPTVQTN